MVGIFDVFQLVVGFQPQVSKDQVCSKGKPRMGGKINIQLDESLSGSG